MPPTSAQSATMEPIAIIGMSSFFPQARDLAEYWDNILSGHDSITDVPASRWNIDDYYDPDPTVPDKSYCKRGGFLPDIDFDPIEFGLPPNILEVTDVSQLLALLAARRALDDAGYDAARGYDFERTGIVLGVCGGQKLMTPLISRLQGPIWERAMRSCGVSEEVIQQAVEKIKLAYVPWEENSFPGLLGNVIAGRIANRLNLGGLNCVTDAACASSFSALQMALSELTEHRADMMITGGVDTDNSPFMYLCFSKTPAFSRGDAPRPFDVNSDGMMVGEGIGLLVLKRLTDAERDGDRVYAVIRGIGSASDGRFKSIYAPRPEGQALALRRAYAIAAVPPASVGLIEAHGTGTVAGDICEVTTLRKVFSEDNSRQQHIALGSVKSQIGHTKAAAGAAGLIKAALALHHKVLPPTIHVSAPNPKFELDGSPLYVNTQTRPWLRSVDTPRRAGISAFGFGGTNFHVVLEEYEPEQQQPYRIHQTPQEILLAAATSAELLAQGRAWLEGLSGPQAQQVFNDLVEAGKNLELPTHVARLGFVAAGPAEAREYLEQALNLLADQPEAEQFQHPRGIFYRQRGVETAGRVALLFPGQGSQYVDMGRTLVANFPPLREWLGHVDAHSRSGEAALAETIFPPPVFSSEEQKRQADRLRRTEYAQPAIGALSAGMFKLLRAAGFAPDFVAGHSFGELTALWAAGAIGDEDYITLMHARGQAMAPPSDASFDAGTMLAVAADVGTVQAIAEQVPEVSLANLNARNQVVLAGPTPAIGRVRELLQNAGHSVTPLPVSAAFHTPLVGHAQAPFSRAVHACRFATPRVPVYANATAQPYPADPQAIQAMLADQMLQPVHFFEQIENLYAAGAYIFVECGPRNVLSNLVANILRDRPHMVVAVNPNRQQDSDRQLREAAVQLRVIGVSMQGVDPFRRLPVSPPTPKRKGLNVRLNGANYVSEQRRAAFAAAIAEQPPASPASAAVPSEPHTGPNHRAPEAVTATAGTVPNPTMPKVSNTSEDKQIMPNNPEETAPAALERSNGFAAFNAQPAAPAHSAGEPGNEPASALDIMARLQTHQQDILQVHQQFLNYQYEYVRLLLQLPQTEAGYREQELATMHQLQAETLRIHQQFMVQQGDYAASLLSLLHQQGNAGPATQATRPAVSNPAPVPEAPPASTPPAAPASGVASLDLATKSTPPPQPAGWTPPPPAPPQPQPQPVAWTPPPPPAAPQPQPQPAGWTPPPPAAPQPAPAQPAPAQPAPADSDAARRLTEGMFTVVSEKTGYPYETLELEMDMETDLGIDSIKRVDILGTMQTRFELPQLAPEELAELRTLGQVVEYLEQALGGSSAAATPTPAPVAAPAAAPAPAVPAVPYAPASLTNLPNPDVLAFNVPQGWTCVITDDGTDMTASVAQALAGRGWRPVVLRLPATLIATRPNLPPNVAQVALSDLSEEQLAQVLRGIAEGYGPIGGFVHLHPQAAALIQNGSMFSDLEQQIVRTVFLAAKQLKPALTGAGQQSRSLFVAVTRLDGELGTSMQQDINPVGGGLFGLVKSLRQEWPNVFCRGLDLHPHYNAEQAAQALLVEIGDPDIGLTEVGYGQRGRVTLAANLVAHGGA